MTDKSSHTAQNKHSPADYQHLQIIRRLAQQNYPFTQDAKTVLTAVAAERASAYDKLFLYAQKLDSDGRIMASLQHTKQAIGMAVKALYLLYFLLAIISTTGLLGSQSINFFYLLATLLGWHTISLMWWLIGLILTNKISIMDNLIDKYILQNALLAKWQTDAKLQKAVLAILTQNQATSKRWQIASIMHGVWLAALVGSVFGLFGLFLFKSYDFRWESTLLSDQHFYAWLAIIGYLPAKLGLALPTMAHTSPAQFAWLAIFSLIGYGILPRLLAYLYSRWQTRPLVGIDTREPYYADLLNYFGQSIIDPDDYQAPTPTIIRTPMPSTARLAIALEKPYLPNTAIGVIDTKAQIDDFLQKAHQSSAQICLIINTDTAPDRGIVRKIERLASHQFGLVAILTGDDSTHLTAWQQALHERQIAIITRQDAQDVL
ncbi:DUF2868 domain-containing protein [Moraxella marmotae]|uniref:DUF2868 domain-containing protein n=1 Tax=Moraxella marmotae TaxID=3344520 RepID=UPI0035F3FDCF